MVKEDKSSFARTLVRAREEVYFFEPIFVFINFINKNSMVEENKDKEKESSFETLKKELQDCQKQKDEYLAGWQRARADFLNYKKEEIERIEEILKYGGEEFILKILPILDNFDLAARQTFPFENLSGQEKEKINQVIQGFLQIKTQILDFLKSQGVEEIKSVGERFDPNLHEAVEMLDEDKSSSRPSSAKADSEVEAKDKEPGITGEEDKSFSSPFAAARVIEEVQKGYKINGRLLRPAKVKVVS